MTPEIKLKALATAQGWAFVNAPRSYQNLQDIANFIADTMEGVGVGETFLFLDPVIRAKKTSEYIDYSGNFMVLTKSDLDETTYADRKTKYIDPVIDILYGTFYNKLRCDFSISDWRSIEVINVFDFNGDGVSMKFTLKG
jgi:hypothetical protein